jgi:hypothetical protein
MQRAPPLMAAEAASVNTPALEPGATASGSKATPDRAWHVRYRWPLTVVVVFVVAVPATAAVTSRIAKESASTDRPTATAVEVADLDSMAPDWVVASAPGTATDDIWFSITDHALHGNDNGNIAIPPQADIGTFHQCAIEQNYGVTLPAARTRPGQLVYAVTNENRVALLRVTDVEYAGDGTPAQITFDVTVWVRLHTI